MTITIIFLLSALLIFCIGYFLPKHPKMTAGILTLLFIPFYMYALYSNWELLPPDEQKYSTWLPIIMVIAGFVGAYLRKRKENF